jgi:hypothetical protein
MSSDHTTNAQPDPANAMGIYAVGGKRPWTKPARPLALVNRKAGANVCCFYVLG